MMNFINIIKFDLGEFDKLNEFYETECIDSQ